MSFKSGASDSSRHVRLEIADQQLLVAGKPVPLRRKTFELLEFLVRHRGRLLTKEQILAEVWPETFITETVIKVCVCELRRALGDDPRGAELIETVYGRGYRFLGEVWVGE